MSKIITFTNHASLYISGVEVFQDISDLSRKKLFTLVSMIHPDEVPPLPAPFRQYFFPIDDAPNASIEKWFEETYFVIASNLLQGNSVLVHCRAGISRSVTVVIAFFLRSFRGNLQGYFVCPYVARRPHQRWTDALLEFIRRNRPQAYPNHGFIQRLYAYEKECVTANDAIC